MLTYAAGNYGQTSLGRVPRSVKGWLLTGLAVSGIRIGGVVGAFLYFTPTLRLIPPEQIATGVTAGMPQCNPATLRSPEQVALAERRQYLYKIISCNNCHGPSAAVGRKSVGSPPGRIGLVT